MGLKHKFSYIQIEIALIWIKTSCFFKFWGFDTASKICENIGDYFYIISKKNNKYFNENNDMLD
jgi:hypothetical protein